MFPTVKNHALSKIVKLKNMRLSCYWNNNFCNNIVFTTFAISLPKTYQFLQL